MSPNLFLDLIVFVGVLYFVNARQQRTRIVLLAQALHPFHIEKLMQGLIEGYLRAMGESDEARRSQVLAMLEISETQLQSQLQRMATDFERTPAAQARISRIAFGLPWATQLLPTLAFDLRRALAIHAAGITRAMENPQGLNARDRAYTITAELLLLQHTCHWFCKSRNVASARLLARHRTAWQQAIAAVTPETRNAYLALITGQQARGQ